VNGDLGRFTTAKGTKRVHPRAYSENTSKRVLLLSQSGGSIRDGARIPTLSRIRDRGEMESGTRSDETGEAHKSNATTRTLGTEFAAMDVVLVTPTTSVAPKTRKVRCCKVRFPPPIVNHILISFFML
jgi:hypothetical protein